MNSVTTFLQQNLDPLISRLLRPQQLTRVATKMPCKLNQLVVEGLINKAFAEQLREGDFEFLADRVLQVEIIDAGLFVGLSYNRNRITCNHFNRVARQSADATLSIDTLSAIQLMQQEVDPDTLFFQRKLKIKGDTALAHEVKNTIDTLDPALIPSILIRLSEAYRLRVL